MYFIKKKNLNDRFFKVATNKLYSNQFTLENGIPYAHLSVPHCLSSNKQRNETDNQNDIKKKNHNIGISKYICTLGSRFK